MTMQEFKNSIRIKDVEGNRTYLHATVNGCEYGQSYQNQSTTLGDMINRFVVFYYPLMQEDQELLKDLPL